MRPDSDLAPTPAPPHVQLVVAESSDFESLVAIRIEAMRESLERIGRFDPTRARERFRAGFSAIHTRHIVVAGERVGFVVLKRQGDELLLDHLYVKPGAQGQGIGAAVLAQVFSEADAQALPIRVGALRESASNRFYVRHGFQLIERGEFDNYYIRPSQNALRPTAQLFLDTLENS
jgi:GNAT superfamily N-acetyltransferase